MNAHDVHMPDMIISTRRAKDLFRLRWWVECSTCGEYRAGPFTWAQILQRFPGARRVGRWVLYA